MPLNKVNIFKNLLEEYEYKDFFISLDKDEGFEEVVRPRSSDLFQEIEISNKKKYLWCTFSHDQIDLNFKNPEVLLFFIKLFTFI